MKKQQKIKSFNFAYSTPYSESVVFDYDGVNFSPNCRCEEDGVVLIFENPIFNVGQIKVVRTYTIESNRFESRVKQIVQVEHLPIEIVQQYGPKSEKINPLPINPSDDITFIETVIIEALQGTVGPKGEDGQCGFDYSNLTEKPITGEFWIGTDGVKKQVYACTKLLTSPSSFTLNADTGDYRWIWNIDLTVKIQDYIIERVIIGGYSQLAARMGLLFTSTSGYEGMGVALWFKNQTDPMLNNQPTVITVKYTKA